MSDRAARAIEGASIILIGLAVLFFGWALLQNLAHFRAASGVALAVVAIAQAFALTRNRGAAAGPARLRSTRDVAFMATALLALTYVLAPQRWAIGACVATLEFAIVIELLTRFAPAPPAS